MVNPKALTVELQDKVLEEFEQHLLAGEWISQVTVVRDGSDDTFV